MYANDGEQPGSSKSTLNFVDEDLMDHFQPIILLSSSRVKQLKKNEKETNRRERMRREGLYSCDICPYKADRKSNLIRHQHYHSGEKPFQCDLCQYNASEKGNLNKHKLTHTGIKNFVRNTFKLVKSRLMMST